MHICTIVQFEEKKKWIIKRNTEYRKETEEIYQSKELGTEVKAAIIEDVKEVTEEIHHK